MSDIRKPLLEIDTMLEARTVLVDGAEYALKRPDDLPELAYRRLNRIGARIDALEQLTDPTEADEKECTELLLQFVQRVLEAPPEVFERLRTKPIALGRIALAFTALRMAPPRPAGGTTTKRGWWRTGVTFFRGWRGLIRALIRSRGSRPSPAE